MKKFLPPISGLIAGLINGLLGAGGGMIIVPMLLKSGLSRKQAHATSVCIILPICIFSSIIYLINGRVILNDVLPYMVWGILGSITGALVLAKINQNLLRRIFGLLIIWAAIRLLIR